MSRGKRNKIEDLRDHLFLALEKLHDGDMDVATARAIREVGQTIVDSAKVEVDFLRVTGHTKSTEFLPADEPEAPRIGWKRPA